MRWLDRFARTLRANWVEVTILAVITALVPSFLPPWLFVVLLLLVLGVPIAHLLTEDRRNLRNRRGDS